MGRRPGPSFVVFVLALAGWTLAGACAGHPLAGSGSGGASDGGEAGSSPSGGGTSGGGATGSAGATGTAGAIGSAGATGAGGITGAAGATGGGAGQGGAGGAVPCGPCANPLCKDGYTSVVDPSISCCPSCRPIDCSMVRCPDPSCPPGYHSEVPTGKCCPVCIMGVSQACNQAQAEYMQARQGFLTKYSETPCTADPECRLVFESNACVTNCGEALPVVTAQLFEDNIASYAQTCDASCPPVASPPCLPLIGVCSNGRCTAVTK